MHGVLKCNKLSKIVCASPQTQLDFIVVMFVHVEDKSTPAPLLLGCAIKKCPWGVFVYEGRVTWPSGSSLWWIWHIIVCYYNQCLGVHPVYRFAIKYSSVLCQPYMPANYEGEALSFGFLVLVVPSFPCPNQVNTLPDAHELNRR